MAELVNELQNEQKKKNELLAQLLQRKSVIISIGIILVMICSVLAAPVLSSYSPNDLAVENRLQAPSSIHFFGTDDFGRDIFSRVLHGGVISLAIGFAVVILAVGSGTLIGLFSGYFKLFDNIVMRVMDGLMSFPGLILAISMIGVLGRGVFTVIISLSIVYLPRVARVVRGSVLVVREYPFVEAEKVLGASKIYILFIHILPNCLSPIIIQSSFIFSYAILGEAALSFLGVGVPPVTPSWGNILSDARLYIVQAWWIAVFPGVAIMITVLGLNMFGDGLRDVLDPKLRNVK
ncbi:ABC transporter permease [Paenibacillus agricola]|uniref:ABC transporter permease n=1 Tax=Paenibacillus agricola TaxID=2716264 RepID=A0ABX0JDI2_9BACL|nr:ABC transporter permease [Paenibacillus agricola]NHN31755.1 ABC transporter permease [Paenibacillus agricola]